jgi:hypothetical protein
MALLTVEERHKVTSTWSIPLLKLLLTAKTIIYIENKLEVGSLGILGVDLTAEMVQWGLSGWLELFTCTEKWNAAYSSLIYLFHPALKAVVVSENILDEILQWKCLLKQTYFAPLRSVRAAYLEEAYQDERRSISKLLHLLRQNCFI